MNREQIAELEKKVLIPTYDRMPILAVRGEGCYLEDDTGKKYLDFLGGLAVNSLGYNHPEIMATVRDAAESLLHVSNLLYHPYQAPLAEKLLLPVIDSPLNPPTPVLVLSAEIVPVPVPTERFTPLAMPAA